MKGKLIKLNVGVGYRLDDEHGNLFASTLQSSKTKLSKQNCDEIFGVVDIEKLADEYSDKYYDKLSVNWHCNYNGYIGGFNKAMELNKDKLFTVEDMKHAMNRVWSWMRNEDEEEYEDCELINEIENKVVQALQQPTEIEVEVVMDRIPADLAPGGWDVFPKLDEKGCIILRKI